MLNCILSMLAILAVVLSASISFKTNPQQRSLCVNIAKGPVRDSCIGNRKAYFVSKYNREEALYTVNSLALSDSRISFFYEVLSFSPEDWRIIQEMYSKNFYVGIDLNIMANDTLHSVEQRRIHSEYLFQKHLGVKPTILILDRATSNFYVPHLGAINRAFFYKGEIEEFDWQGNSVTVPTCINKPGYYSCSRFEKQFVAADL